MSVRRNVVANHVGQAWAALVALLCLPLYVRYLGIEVDDALSISEQVEL